MTPGATMTGRTSGAHSPLLSSVLLGWARDFWVILILVSPIYGCFFPAESYTSLPSNEGRTGYQGLSLPITTIEVILMGVTSLLYFWMAWRRGGFRHVHAAYALMALAILSAGWAADPVASILRALRLIPLVLFAISLPQLYGVKRCLYLMTVAFFISAIMSIAISIANPALAVGRIGGAYGAAWRGAMVQKNLTGVIFVVGIYISALAWMVRGNRLSLSVVTALLSLFMLVMSQSGTSAVALICGVGTTAILMVIQRCPPNTRVLLMIGSVLGVIGLGLFVGMLADILINAAGRDMTFTGRTPIWAAAWRLIEMHPFRGYGYGFWTQESVGRQTIWTDVGWEAGHAHNSWLDIWLQLGIVGFLLMVAITLRGLSSALKLAVVDEDPTGPVFFGAMTVLLIRSMTEVQYTDPFPSILFFPIWSIICADMMRAGAVARRRRRSAAVSTPHPRRTRALPA